MPTGSEKNAEGVSRVTRSSRRIGQSSDLEESPASSVTSPKTTRKKMNSISEQDADIESCSVASLSESQLSRSKDPGSEETTTVRRTRGRASSTLTVENVTALNETPVRRMTRRNSVSLDPVAVEPSVVATTPGRRTTRRSSITSEDNASVASSTLTGRPRRNASVAKTLTEEDESTPVASKTPGRKRNASTSEQDTSTPRKTSGRSRIASISEQDVSSPRKTPGRRSIATVPVLLEEEEEDIFESSPKSVDVDPKPSATQRKTPGRKSIASVPIVIEEDDEDDVIESSPKEAELSLKQSNRKSLSVIMIEDSVVDEKFSTPQGNGNETAPTEIKVEGTPQKAAVPVNPESATKSTPYPTAIIKASPQTVAMLQTPTKRCSIIIERMSDKKRTNITDALISDPVNTGDTEDKAADEELNESKNVSLVSEASEYMDASNVQEDMAEPVPDAEEPMEVSISETRKSLNKSIIVVSDDKSLVLQIDNESTPLKKSDTTADLLSDDESAKLPGSAFKSLNQTSVAESPLKTPAATKTTDAEVSKNNDTPQTNYAADADKEATPEFAEKKTPEQNVEEFSEDTKEEVDAIDTEVDAIDSEVDANGTEKVDVIETEELDASDTVSKEMLEEDVQEDSTHEKYAASQENVEANPEETSPQSSPDANKSSTILQSEESKETSPAEENATESTSAIRKSAENGVSKSKKRQTIHTIVAENSPKSSEVLSRSWSQAVHGTSTAAIDRSLHTEDEVKVIKKPIRKPTIQDFDDDDEEDTSNDGSRNSFVDDEAEEGDGDSMDSEERAYIEANEIREDGISIGSEDSHQEVDDEEEDDDSFIVSDSEMVEDELEGTGDDLSTGHAEECDNEHAEKKKPRRSVMKLADSSDDEEVGANELRLEDDVSKHEDEDVAENGDEDVAENGDEDVSENGDEDLAENGDEDVAENEDEEMPSHDEEMPSNDEEKSKESIEVTERQVQQLLSKSVHQISKKHKKAKLNQSVREPSDTDANMSFTSYVAAQKAAKVTTQPESDTADVDMESPPPKPKTPKQKTPKPKVIKKVPQSYEDIMSRCDSILSQANEARRQEKLQNKKDIPEDLIEKKKNKREQKQLEKARRAANLLKIQQDEADKQKRKAEKKLAKKNADPVVVALEHGIELLSKKSSVNSVVVSEAAQEIPKKSSKRVKEQQVPELKLKYITEQIVEPEIKVKKPKKAKHVEVPNAVEETQAKVKPSQKKNAEPLDVPVVLSNPNKKQKKSKHVEPVVEEAPEPEMRVKKQKKLKSAAVVEEALPETKKTKKSSKLVEEICKASKITSIPEPSVEKQSKKNKRARAEAQETTDSEQVAPPAAKKFKKTKGDVAPKKLLNILSKTISSESEPEPPKPSKKQPSLYNVLQVRSVPTATNSQNKTQSRKRKPIETPAKPQWTSAGEFVVSKIPQEENRTSHQVAHRSAGTEFTVTTLSKKRKLKLADGGESRTVDSVVAKAAEFRVNAMNSDRVKRVPTAEMLQHKKKMQAFSRF